MLGNVQQQDFMGLPKRETVGILHPILSGETRAAFKHVALHMYRPFARSGRIP
jgi:hypothetical protein